MSPDACNKLLEILPSMSRPELQQLWSTLFGRPPHPKLRRQLMIPILAYRAQEKTYGGLKAATRRYLLRLAQQIEGGGRRFFAAERTRGMTSGSASDLSPRFSTIW